MYWTSRRIKPYHAIAFNDATRVAGQRPVEGP
jgi:hypothetical protein